MVLAKFSTPNPHPAGPERLVRAEYLDAAHQCIRSGPPLLFYGSQIKGNVCIACDAMFSLSIRALKIDAYGLLVYSDPPDRQRFQTKPRRLCEVCSSPRYHITWSSST
ncbi:hypothetical protein SCLCIDRAFT_801468 [Scleroderma citrinum Foug A]|uniref:Uncharacterized protein n=1 Tax=Scleroderma citrinum Foug A TaxID=1036808 RepID=A0A0C3E366_9AGAM|nr:hypothetical protein SCLCIDRAFT_801468 [Scleroderma citrinum Foug A]